MKISTPKILALGGLCALFVSAGNVAFAQGYDHNQDRNGDYGQASQSDRHSDYGQDNQDSRRGQSQDHHDRYNQDQARNDHGGRYDSHYRQSDQYRHGDRNERRRLDRLHAAYAHAASHGNYGAAERAHQHAQAIRARLHDQRGDRDHGNDDHGNDH